MIKLIEIKVVEEEHDYVLLQNAKGDTFSYNPLSGNGEELANFLLGVKIIGKSGSVISQLPEDQQHFITLFSSFMEELSEERIITPSQKSDARKYMLQKLGISGEPPKHKCADCGEALKMVKPGKHQCDNVDCQG